MDRFYEDLQILIQEANMTDERLMQLNPNFREITPCMTLSINLIVESMIDYLTHGFSLELYAPYEMAMHFNYLRYLYIILRNNRRVMI